MGRVARSDETTRVTAGGKAVKAGFSGGIYLIYWVFPLFDFFPHAEVAERQTR